LQGAPRVGGGSAFFVRLSLRAVKNNLTRLIVSLALMTCGVGFILVGIDPLLLPGIWLICLSNLFDNRRKTSTWSKRFILFFFIASLVIVAFEFQAGATFKCLPRAWWWWVILGIALTWEIISGFRRWKNSRRMA
jgi:hypothetical protein